MNYKILLDTDIGTDIDDALCLAYLLKNPDCELLGITTVTGEPEKRAMLASVICKLAGKEPPIFPGAADPLIVKQKQSLAQQAKFLDRWKHDKKFPQGEAINFLRQTIRDQSGEIVLLAIGPLTNIGILFSLDPEIPGLLKGLVMMNGYFKGQVHKAPTCEWNASGDPHASHIVYSANIPVHRAVGLDVTSLATCSSTDLKRKFNTEILEPVHDFAEAWYEYSDLVTFHDPLAAVSIFNRDLVKFERGQVIVDIYKKETLGRTVWQPDGKPAMNEIAVSVSPEKFFEAYLSVVQ